MSARNAPPLPTFSSVEHAVRAGSVARGHLARRVQRRAAVAVILREAASDIELLLVRRAQRAGDPWSGHVALPGGVASAGDLDLAHTARRETEEEVGLQLAPELMWGRLATRWARDHRRWRPMTVTPVVFGLAGESGRLVAGPEVDSAFWVSVQALRDPASAGVRPWRVGRVTLNAPAWNTAGGPVWGLTRAILQDLIRRL
jgi:8-oxo-dGTP pyrophosphatase MutT (NUDIX family)